MSASPDRTPDRAITSVCIVGGGSAGWLTAALIAARHGPDVAVTLVESVSRGTIGVGEGTWPTMRNTLRKIGIAETDFMRACHASFKQGAKFARWRTGADDDFYYHPLVLPEGFPDLDLAPYWNAAAEQARRRAIVFRRGVLPGIPVRAGPGAQADHLARICRHRQLCLSPRCGEAGRAAGQPCHAEAGRAPHRRRDRGRRARRGWRRARGDRQRSGPIAADLFVDCTGFAARLLGEALEVPFIDRSDVLFIDRALAVQVPVEPDSPIASHTISTAQKHGWIWDIGLPTRRGIGYVYSSRHAGADRAEEELAAYVGPGFASLTPREIPIRSGHRALFWKTTWWPWAWPPGSSNRWKHRPWC
jgi:hypothetical protein